MGSMQADIGLKFGIGVSMSGMGILGLGIQTQMSGTCAAGLPQVDFGPAGDDSARNQWLSIDFLLVLFGFHNFTFG